LPESWTHSGLPLGHEYGYSISSTIEFSSNNNNYNNTRANKALWKLCVGGWSCGQFVCVWVRVHVRDVIADMLFQIVQLCNWYTLQTKELINERTKEQMVGLTSSRISHMMTSWLRLLGWCCVIVSNGSLRIDDTKLT